MINDDITEIRVGIATIVAKQADDRKIIENLVEKVNIQNGSVASVKTAQEVMKGQFSLTKWVIGAIAIPVVLAAISELSGVVQ